MFSIHQDSLVSIIQELGYLCEKLTRYSYSSELGNKNFMVYFVEGFSIVQIDNVHIIVFLQMFNDAINVVNKLRQTASPISEAVLGLCEMVSFKKVNDFSSDDPFEYLDEMGRKGNYTIVFSRCFLLSYAKLRR